MGPTQNRRSGYAFPGGLPISTQTPVLDDIINLLHTKYGFPKEPKEIYVHKLGSLMESESGRVNDAITSLDAVVRGQRNRWKGTNGVRKLVKVFEDILESQLSQFRDVHDRDLSILPLIGMEPAGDILSRECNRAESPPITLNLQQGQHPQHLLDGIQTSDEAVTDVDDSDHDSFYSCIGTPPRSESVVRLNTGTSCLSPPDGRDSIQKPRRTAYRNPEPNTIQQMSHSRPSVFTNSGERPRLSNPLSNPGTGTRRGFHSVLPLLYKQQGDFEEPIRVPSETTTTGSAQSSFNASSSFSSRVGKDWSPPTSADTSFNETGDPITRPIRQKVLGTARLAIVAEGVREANFVGEPESPYNADLDGETTDIDDPKCLRALPQRPRKLLQPTTPQNRPSQRRRKRGLIALQPSGGEEHKDHAQKVKQDKEEAFQRLAEAFFGGESGPDSGSPLAPSNSSVRKQNRSHPVIGGDGEVESLLGEAGEYSVGEWVDGRIELGREEDVQEQRDDDDSDDYGTMDSSFEGECSNLPALKPAAHPLHTLPFPVQYEATRVALNQRLRSNDAICAHLDRCCDDLYKAKEYTDIWKTLTQFSIAAEMLEQTSESIWRGFKEGSGWPDNVYLTGSVDYVEMSSSPSRGKQIPSQEQGSGVSLAITLNPLTRTTGNRFFNRFGSDRFLTLRLPPLTSHRHSSNQQRLSKGAVQQRRERIIDWLVDDEIQLMNRTWKCYYIKEGRSKKKSGKTMITEHFFQAVFFATKGAGIGDNISDREMDGLGFRKDGRKLRQEMSREELLKWHIPLAGNLGMTVQKFWSRISLGFSDATPTITFEPSQIEFVDDIRSPTGEVMNDGCSVASPAVMKMVRKKLGLEETPTAVQARLGGAKGVWMVDPVVDWGSEDIYIKVTKSQLKYKGYDNEEDWARLTLDVLSASHDPTPATINTQYIPILVDRGVPFPALKELLEEHLEADLDQLFQVLDQPVELRRWMYDRGNVGKERMVTNTITTLGSIPGKKHERAIMLLESGFLVRECNFLMLQVRDIIDQYCNDLKAKLHIKIPNSTTLLCVADPTGTLKEGEVSLRFSNGILDPKTLRKNQVVVGDILVARNPAHLPSDIQKVKAVDTHSPALRELQDVIVFSVQGTRSLASLLSGGDYDGDKPWVCWDERIVSPFQNSDSTFEEYGERVQHYFEQSSTKMKDLNPDQPGFFDRFFRSGISNALQDNFLGYCTTIWEKYCYKHNCIWYPQALEMAKMCSVLVDAPKQGLTIISSKRDEIARLGSQLPNPAYKDPKCQSQGVHVIDQLHFDVAGQKIMEKQTAFHNDIGQGTGCDPQLTKVYHQEKGLAKKRGFGKPLDLVLKHLEKELVSLRDDWIHWNGLKKDGNDEFKAGAPHFYRRFRDIKPPTELSEDPIIGRWTSEGDHFSDWTVLRASAAFYKWKGMTNLVWYMAGRELCYMKSLELSRKSGLEPRVLIEGMYVPLKTSGKFRGVQRVTAAEDKAEEEEDSI